MIEYIEEYNSAYEQFNLIHPKGTIFQSFLWSRCKPMWYWRGILVRRQGEITGVMGVLIRSIPGTPWSILYAPRGPVCDPHDEQTHSELTEGLKTIADEEGAYLLKLDPDILADDKLFQEIMTALGYQHGRERQHFENVQPQYVVRLDLRGKTEDEVFARLNSKTRYNIRLAQRRGVEVRICGKESLNDFCRLMETTGQRDHFCTRPQSYFEGMLDALGNHARLYMAYYEHQPIAGTICLQYGNKTWYLYGASSNEHREKMPNYLLQWRMIQWAMESRCDIYDFRGISGSEDPNDPLAGLWWFKRGWGGEKNKFTGEWEYVFRPGAYRILNRLLPVARRGLVNWANFRRHFHRDTNMIQSECKITLRKEGNIHDQHSDCRGREADLRSDSIQSQ